MRIRRFPMFIDWYITLGASLHPAGDIAMDLRPIQGGVVSWNWNRKHNAEIQASLQENGTQRFIEK